MMRLLLMLTLTIVAADDDLPPSCEKPIFCDSLLLHTIQCARLFPDSKTFVDLQLRHDENTTLNEFQMLYDKADGKPSKEQLQEFVNNYFEDVGELEEWTPNDYNANPTFLENIHDETLREFAKSIHKIWPTLGRKVKTIVRDEPHLFSLVWVPEGFIIPGGRFTELYYWDTYWIMEGLIISGMHETVKGKIKNLMELLRKFGHIPNGSRWYYQERSQPPLLTAMMALYVKATNDLEFLEQNILGLEKEVKYWLDSQIVTFVKDGRTYTLLRYYAPSKGPRPESYYEDYRNSLTFDTEEKRTEFFINLKSGAESGWDFSSRWFISDNGDNAGNLTNIHVQQIIPVDLNAIFANALQNIADFYGLLKNPRKAAHWAYLAKQWRSNIEEVLWNKDDGTWYDYDFINEQHRKYFYPSNVAPLWMQVVDPPLIKRHAPKLLEYLCRSNGLSFPGGVPASLNYTGEQWDYPNAWPPLVSIVVNALEALETEDGTRTAIQVAQNWIRACLKGYQAYKQMFEKYDVRNPGILGGGGEYTVQIGFGWSNGVVLEFLNKYGSVMTAED